MAARTNKRIFYANKAVGINTDGDTSFGSESWAKGVQEVGISTNFNNTPYFEIGQLEIYEDVEELPDVEWTLSKTFDSRPLLWHMATRAATAGPRLINRSNVKCVMALGIFADTNDFATSTPDSFVISSGMFPSNLQYSYTVDGNMTESMSLVGNNKLWRNDSKIVNSSDLATISSFTFALTTSFSGDTTTNSYVDFTTSTGGVTVFITGVQRRQHLIFAEQNTGIGLDTNSMRADYDQTILPPEVDGISTSGTNNKTNGQDFDAHVQSINVSVDLGRDELNELGRKGPYHRVVQYPVEVTCAIEVLSTSGDMISASEGGIYSTSTSQCAANTNLRSRTIRIANCNGERIYLGTKNKLTSVNFGGGTTAGGNDTVTYNFRNYNILTVMSPVDPNTLNTGVGGWWATRSSYLVN